MNYRFTRYTLNIKDCIEFNYIIYKKSDHTGIPNNMAWYFPLEKNQFDISSFCSVSVLVSVTVVWNLNSNFHILININYAKMFFFLHFYVNFYKSDKSYFVFHK